MPAEPPERDAGSARAGGGSDHPGTDDGEALARLVARTRGRRSLPPGEEPTPAVHARIRVRVSGQRTGQRPSSETGAGTPPRRRASEPDAPRLFGWADRRLDEADWTPSGARSPTDEHHVVLAGRPVDHGSGSRRAAAATPVEERGERSESEPVRPRELPGSRQLPFAADGEDGPGASASVTPVATTLAPSDTEPAAESDASVRDARRRVAVGRAPARRPQQSGDGEWETPRTGPAAGEDTGEQPPPAGNDRSRLLRLGGFGAVVVLLAAAIPVLTVVGYRWITHSRAGVTRVDVGPGGGGARVVSSTPTALVVFTGADGQPSSVALLSLSGTNGKGGSIVGMPRDTAVRHPAYYIDKLSTAWKQGGLRTLSNAASATLNLTFDKSMELNPQALTELVQKVGSIQVHNPTAYSGRNRYFPAGTVTLSPDQVTDYLGDASTDPNKEPEAVARQLAVWKGWLAAVAQRPHENVVPGGVASSLDHFAHVLASGPVTYEQLPTRVVTSTPPNGQSSTTYKLRSDQVNRMLTLAVPFPEALASVRLQIQAFNGYDKYGIPPSLLQRMVLGGGQLVLVGTASVKKLSVTQLRYGDAGLRPRLKRLRRALGGGKLVFDDTVSDEGEVIVVLGKDLVAQPPPKVTEPSR